MSGNPTGRPKTFSIHQLVAEAIDDKDTRTEAVQRLRDNLKRAKTVVNTLEFAARVNREIGLNSDAPTGGVTIIFQSNLQPGALGRLKNPNRPTLNVRPVRRGRDRKNGVT